MAKRRNSRKPSRRPRSRVARVITKVRWRTRKATRRGRGRSRSRKAGGGFLAAVAKVAITSAVSWGVVKVVDKIKTRGVWRAAIEGGSAVGLALLSKAIGAAAAKVPGVKVVVTRGSVMLLAGAAGVDALRRVVQDPGVRAAVRRLAPGKAPPALPEGGNVQGVMSPRAYAAAR